jgi:actin related protein 2/3 complex subunit 2
MQMVKQVCSDAVEIVEPAKEGYQLTLKLNFAKVPIGKGLLLLQINTNFFKKKCLVLCDT